MAEHSERLTRRQILGVVGVTTAVWFVLSSSWLLLPIRLLVTLVHEAGHAVALEVLGGDVQYVIINEHGGGLTSGRLPAPTSSLDQVIVSSAGYLGTAIVGGLLLEASTRLRRGRIGTVALAVVVVAIGLAWVPWNVEPDAFSAAATGSSAGDGRFTILVCVLAVAALVGLAWQPIARLRTGAVAVLATAFCLASIDDLRFVLDLSSRGGHSDAAAAASVTSLSSWMWAAIWLVMGGVACALGLWAALSDDEGDRDVEPVSLPPTIG